MMIYSVADEAFRPYGRIVEGYHVNGILDALKKTPVPENVIYTPREDALHQAEHAQEVGIGLFGGMPFEFGYCNGHNTKLNCLEFHRDSEFNLGTEDFILLLAKQGEIVNGRLDTSCVKAFRVPAGVLVEVYATTLHYAPCHTDAEGGFRVAVVLPKGTNTEKPEYAACNEEDKWMTARNKWLLAHPESAEAGQGAYVGLTGENIDIAG